MEKEQIIKALECCTRGRKSKEDRPCLECHYNECNLVGGTGERQISGTCQGWLMKDALSLILEQEKRIEELALENAGFEAGARYASKFIRADTVRNMQEKFTIHFGTYTDKDEVKISEVFRLLSKFAKEMLEDVTPPQNS